MMYRRFSVSMMLTLCVLSCAQAPSASSEAEPEQKAQAQTRAETKAEAPEALLPLVDVTAASGLDFLHQNGMTGEWYMPENMGGGGALLDVDRDGDLDLVLLQGDALDRSPDRLAEPMQDRLFLNESTGGEIRFVDATEGSGLGHGYGMGAATGDVDGDGLVDLYLTRFGPNRLFRNRGDGTFEDVTSPELTDARWSVPAVFFDYDLDGRLDLFVGNYVDFKLVEHRPCTNKAGARDYCDPSVYEPVPDLLLRNVSEGGKIAFEDVTIAAGLDQAFGKALGAAVADFNGDGRLDLYVADDGEENQLWMNQGDGKFIDDALFAGAAVNEAGQAEASMGVVADDLDGDGDVDLLLSHLRGETHTFYRNDGKGVFEDFTVRSGIGPATLDATGFGLGAADFDGDGVLDLFSVSGAVRAIEAQRSAGDPYPFAQPNQLLRGLGDGRFALARTAGPALDPVEVSRGAIFGDLDDDGDSDVIVVNNHGPARLLAGDLAGEDWIGFSGLPNGATISLQTSRGERVRRAGSDGSYASANDPRVLFRLAADEEVRGASAFSAGGVRVVWNELDRGAYHPLPTKGASE